MVNITMDQIIAFSNANSIFNTTALPLKVAYKLNKIKKAVDENREFYNEKLEEIIDKYAKRDENGELVFNEDKSQIIIKDDQLEECNKALQELQELTVEIDNYNLTIDDFGDEVECTPEALEALMPFLN